jgi:hypothetical protein
VPFAPTAPGKTGIGLAWGVDADIDLYVRADPRAKELSYQLKQTPEGRLVSGDIRHANVGRTYEYMEFSRPIDLSRATVWVNYYRGRARAVLGQVVLFRDGRVWVGQFRIAAARGNGGSDADRRDRSPYWQRIDLDQLTEASAPLAAQRPEGR